MVSVRRGQGLPKHSQFQLASVDPLQDTAEPISEAGGGSVQMYFKKCRKCWKDREGRTKRSEKQQREHQGQRKWSFLPMSHWGCVYVRGSECLGGHLAASQG